MITQREYIEACRVRFRMDDVTEIMPAALWIWDTIIAPLQAELKEAEERVDVLESELTQAEERAEDANSGFNKGLDY